MEFLLIIVAALVGALLTYLAQNYFAMQIEDSIHLNDHIAEIRLIEAFAVAYWSVEQGEDEKVLRLHQAKLEGAISASGCFNEDARRILRSNYDQYVKLDQAIFEASTGGDFGTSSKNVEYDRVVEIMTLCCRMRSLLRRSRRRQYWAH